MKLSAPINRLKRNARLLARDKNIPLHAALDRVARNEGFSSWSLLSAHAAQSRPAAGLFTRLQNGDVLLLGARPGQGKTLRGLELLVDAERKDRQAVFFTLDYSEEETRTHLEKLADTGVCAEGNLEIVASDDISAAFVMQHLAKSAAGTVAVIDYLQILDQQRTKPALAEQLTALSGFAREKGIVLVFLSQIDRSFDARTKALPDIKDIRLPNPVDLKLFTKACFIHGKASSFVALQ
ncbi:MAG: DNA helicase [Roseibium sp.]|uniref:DNA helicase n=1 Tax=Roseibium sp. TaxID=1936156 RepID=UPI001B17E288|nr:DNA helicase [Roseibium sp.]MBO6890407.1 DNA helicase [Roseibium sp.]MBO6929152.1 DNA helicase [Roseibium sp.]